MLFLDAPEPNKTLQPTPSRLASIFTNVPSFRKRAIYLHPRSGWLSLAFGYLTSNTSFIMAIYGIGAYYDHDVSPDFISSNLAGVGWNSIDAPELHKFIASLKVGDIVYLKAASPSSPDIIVRGIGFIRDDINLTAATTNNLVQAGRNIVWRVTTEFRIPKPRERNNVRLNTMYEEFHPDVQAQIIARL